MLEERVQQPFTFANLHSGVSITTHSICLLFSPAIAQGPKLLPVIDVAWFQAGDGLQHPQHALPGHHRQLSPAQKKGRVLTPGQTAANCWSLYSQTRRERDRGLFLHIEVSDEWPPSQANRQPGQPARQAFLSLQESSRPPRLECKNISKENMWRVCDGPLGSVGCRRVVAERPISELIMIYDVFNDMGLCILYPLNVARKAHWQVHLQHAPTARTGLIRIGIQRQGHWNQLTSGCQSHR